MKNSINILSNVLLLFILLNSIISCNTYRVEKKLKDCVNNEVVISCGLTNKDFDFYALMKKVEIIMIEEKVINNISADEFIKLITDISDSTNENHQRFYNIVLKQFKKEKVILYPSFQAVNYVCVDCPFKILIEERNKMYCSLLFQVQYGNELEANNYYDKSILINLIKAIERNNDFDKIEYRTPILIYILLGLGEQVAPDY